MDKAITILSGGLDSAVSTAIARKSRAVTLAVTFDYGQKAARREIEASARLCDEWGIEHKIIQLDFLSEESKSSLTSRSGELPHIETADLDDKKRTMESARSVWVPNRNGIFINIAAGIAEARNIKWLITGFNKEEAETFPDNSARYIELANQCLAYSTLSKPEVISFVMDMDKIELVTAAKELGIDIGRLWPCYDGGEKWCGHCESCARTMRAMEQKLL